MKDAPKVTDVEMIAELERTRVLCQSWHDDAIATQKMLMEANAEVERLTAANKAQAAERERCAQLAEHASCSGDKGYDTGRPAMSDDADAVIEAMILAVSNLRAESKGGFSSEQVVQTALRAGEKMGWKMTHGEQFTDAMWKAFEDGEWFTQKPRPHEIWRELHAAAPALGGDDATARAQAGETE